MPGRKSSVLKKPKTRIDMANAALYPKVALLRNIIAGIFPDNPNFASPVAVNQLERTHSFTNLRLELLLFLLFSVVELEYSYVIESYSGFRVNFDRDL